MPELGTGWGSKGYWGPPVVGLPLGLRVRPSWASESGQILQPLSMGPETDAKTKSYSPNVTNGAGVDTCQLYGASKAQGHSALLWGQVLSQAPLEEHTWLSWARVDKTEPSRY